MYWIYSFLYGLALLISLPYWLIGMARAGKYRAGLMERFGAIAQRLELPYTLIEPLHEAPLGRGSYTPPVVTVNR